MADGLYSYRDELPEDLRRAWEDARGTEEDGADGEPELALAGFGRDALVVTRTRLYALSGAVVPFFTAPQRISVWPLADLAVAEVQEGLIWHHLRLRFEPDDRLDLRTRLGDRDKMRVAARMLAAMALRAKELEKEAALARRSRAAAEAAAARTERTSGNRGRLRSPAPAGAAVLTDVAGARRAAADDALPLGARTAFSGPQDAVELLRGLWQLVEVGALSSAEFQAKKADLLGRL